MKRQFKNIILDYQDVENKIKELVSKFLKIILIKKLILSGVSKNGKIIAKIIALIKIF